MTAPGTGETSSPDNNPVPTVSSRSDVQDRNKFPILLLAGIFAIVSALVYFIVKDNWAMDKTRYDSIEAQKRGDWADSIALLEKLRHVQVSNGPNYAEFSPTYLSEIAYCYVKLNDYDKALEYYKLAQQYKTNVPADDSFNPRDFLDFNYMIGYVLYKQNKLDEAEKTLREALTFDKLNPLANFTLGEIAMKRGDYIHAADYFKIVSEDLSYKEQVRKYYAEIEDKLFAGIK